MSQYLRLVVTKNGDLKACLPLLPIMKRHAACCDIRQAIIANAICCQDCQQQKAQLAGADVMISSMNVNQQVLVKLA